MTTFETVLPILLKQEGGYVNNRHDPGGMTNLGVTKRVWEAWTHRTASEADMRALTPTTVAPLYRVQYWNGISGDALHPALALCVFDFAVNSGPSRAARYLQRLVGARQDGYIGPGTLAALDKWLAANSVAKAVRTYQTERRIFYRQLDGFPVFGKGWLNRCDDVETAALKLC